MNSYRLILLLILFGSCSESTERDSQRDSVVGGEQDTKATVVLPKLPLTQGSTNYDNINCAVADNRGNLWFGSSGEGVYRYDGTSFEQFTVNDGLSSNIVKCLLVDQWDHLWIGTSNGICKYNGATIEKIPIIVPDVSILENPQPPRTNEIWNMIQSRDGTLWFTTTMGVFTYDGNNFLQFPNDYPVTNSEFLQMKMVCDILEDRDGNIWFTSGTTEGVMKYDKKYITSSKPNGDGWVRTIMQDQQGKIWFNGRHKGNFTFYSDSFSMFTAKEKIGGALLQDTKGNLWFSGEEDEDGFTSVDGVWRYDGTTFTNFSIKDGMADYGVWCMLEDQKGNIWFGTRNNGLYKYDGKSFTCYSE